MNGNNEEMNNKRTFEESQDDYECSAPNKIRKLLDEIEDIEKGPPPMPRADYRSLYKQSQSELIAWKEQHRIVKDQLEKLQQKHTELKAHLRHHVREMSWIVEK